MEVAAARYVEIHYSLSPGFTGAGHQLRLTTSDQAGAFEPFTNDETIPAAAGTHRILIDLLSDDGVSLHGRRSGEWTQLRWDFWNNSGNGGSSFTLDKVVFGNAVTPAGSTIDTADRHGWGENLGWTNWRWDTGTPGSGATIGQFYCAGLIWGENVGWIVLGTGAPANGIQYGNADGADFGVNHDGTGKLSGYAWAESCGWIDLGSNGIHFVKTNAIAPGADLDLDMIADAWELEQATNAGIGGALGPGLTHLDKTTDSDGDGESDYDEYLADSDPFDAADGLRVVAIGVDEIPALGTADITLEWTSSPRRLYDLGSSTDLNPFTVEMADLPPDAGPTTAVIFDDGPLVPRKYWRVGAKLPLAP